MCVRRHLIRAETNLYRPSFEWRIGQPGFSAAPPLAADSYRAVRIAMFFRPSVASIGDHARMLASLGRDHDIEALRTIRRLIELDRQLERGRQLEP